MTADAALGRLMLAFEGTALPDDVRRRLTDAPAAGVTLFRYRNVETPAQVRSLVDEIQACAPPGQPFLVAMDQEGGQLRGLGPGSTAFPGNMALGATGDPELSRRVGQAIGRELRAVGANVNYAPVADLATNPGNPALGVRSFGDDPERVADHVAAMIDGLESAGVSSTLKHFPGKGDAGVDTHHELATVERSLEQLAERELVPFRAALGRASMVMSGHFGIPGLTDGRPATLSARVMRDLLRTELGFGGVTISDAFDMDALSPGAGRQRDAVEGLNGGLDLLLLGGTSDVAAFDRALLAADRDGELDGALAADALRRIAALRARFHGDAVPDLAVVGCQENADLARAVAAGALTLVRDRDGLLPLRVTPDDPIVVISPRPGDLTPADTSAGERPALAPAIRRRHPNTREHLVPHAPSPADIAAAADLARDAAVVVIGTVSASLEPTQAALVRAVLGVGRPTVTVALRTPWDLGSYPAAGTHVCTFSIVEPSCEALAAAVFGRADFPGRLPVSPR